MSPLLSMPDRVVTFMRCQFKEKETIMNESEKLLKKVTERFEHAEYVKMTVTERQVADLLIAAHYLFKAEDGTMRVNPNLYGSTEKRG